MTDAIGAGGGTGFEGARTLEAGAFSFHGYDGLMDEFERRLRNVGLRGGAPRATVVEGAVFVPDLGRRGGAGQPKFGGGIVDAEGRPVDAAALRRKGGRRVGGPAEPLAVTGPRELDEEVVYLGWLFNHYGQVLLETLARVWYLAEVAPSVRVVVGAANTAQEGQRGWLPRVLAAFGIPSQRLLVLDRPTRFRRAIVPEPLFEQGHAAHEAMILPFRAVAERIAGDVTPATQPVYLSRSRLPSRSRPILGEEALEEVLRENGFLVVHPETMTFEDQVQLVSAHADIFSAVGSAAHSVLFARGRPSLHLLANGGNVPANFFLCSALAGVPTTFVNCLGSGPRGNVAVGREVRRTERRGVAVEDGYDVTAGTQAGPQCLDLERLVGYLEELGFLKKDRRPAAARRALDVRDRYDEAWFYARVRGASIRRGTLPPALAAEVVSLAARSWPLCWVLARYYAVAAEDAVRADEMARRFVDLVATETEASRLAYYREDVRGMTKRIARICTAETARLLAEVVRARFGDGGVGDEAAGAEA